MKYAIHIKSEKNLNLTESSQYFDFTYVVEAKDRCEAVGLAMKIADADKIDSAFLPLTITVNETF